MPIRVMKTKDKNKTLHLLTWTRTPRVLQRALTMAASQSPLFFSVFLTKMLQTLASAAASKGADKPYLYYPYYPPYASRGYAADYDSIPEVGIDTEDPNVYTHWGVATPVRGLGFATPWALDTKKETIKKEKKKKKRILTQRKRSAVPRSHKSPRRRSRRSRRKIKKK